MLAGGIDDYFFVRSPCDDPRAVSQCRFERIPHLRHPRESARRRKQKRQKTLPKARGRQLNLESCAHLVSADSSLVLLEITHVRCPDTVLAAALLRRAGGARVRGAKGGGERGRRKGAAPGVTPPPPLAPMRTVCSAARAGLRGVCAGRKARKMCVQGPRTQQSSGPGSWGFCRPPNASGSGAAPGSPSWLKLATDARWRAAISSSTALLRARALPAGPVLGAACAAGQARARAALPASPALIATACCREATHRRRRASLRSIARGHVDSFCNMFLFLTHDPGESHSPHRAAHHYFQLRTLVLHFFLRGLRFSQRKHNLLLQSRRRERHAMRAAE